MFRPSARAWVLIAIRRSSSPSKSTTSRAIAEESAKVVELAGIPLAYLDIKDKVYNVCETTAENTSSMLQDILRDRRTEIDAINGAIVEKAKELNIEIRRANTDDMTI